jgi:hypothetical protein
MKYISLKFLQQLLFVLKLDIRLYIEWHERIFLHGKNIFKRADIPYF